MSFITFYWFFIYEIFIINPCFYRTRELAAVKIVKLESGDNFAVIQQEILLLRECVHPNIISYYASYIRKDRLWIVMEYCQGGSLQDIYQREFLILQGTMFDGSR